MKKKKLLYIYIDDNSGFFRQGINFSTKEQFCVREKTGGHLYLKRYLDEKKLPDNFWANNISEISLLVGENGSGKTTLMRLICQWVCGLSKSIFPQEKGILVFQKDNFLGYIAFSEGKELDIISDIPQMSLSDFFDDLKLIYFSNTMTEMYLNDFDILLDYSMSKRLKDANTYGWMVSLDPLTAYKQYEFIKQVDQMLKGDIKVSANYIQMGITEISFEKICQMLPEQCKDTINDLKGLWDYYFDNENLEYCAKGMKLIIKLIQAFFSDMIIKMIKMETKINDGGKNTVFAEALKDLVLDEKISGNSNNIQISFQWVIRFLKDLAYDYRMRYETSEYNTRDDKIWADYHKSIDVYFSVLLWFTKQEAADFFAKWKNTTMHKNETTSIWQIEIQDNKSDFLTFWNVYKKVVFSSDSVYFCWNISSGEENRINLFSILSEIDEEDTNIWILLDEPDNTFHPDWSKGLIKDITKICKRNDNKVFQTWISTHSPLLLSDIPGLSAFYLKNDEVRKRKMVLSPSSDTFGQNIYVLYNDAFFLKDGVIGEFASDKIVEFVLKLEEIEKKILVNTGINDLLEEWIEECEKISALVAEPIYKHQMEYYLRNCKRLVKRTREQESKGND